MITHDSYQFDNRYNTEIINCIIFMHDYSSGIDICTIIFYNFCIIFSLILILSTYSLFTFFSISITFDQWEERIIRLYQKILFKYQHTYSTTHDMHLWSLQKKKNMHLWCWVLTTLETRKKAVKRLIVW